jgi:hypothetical protein
VKWGNSGKDKGRTLVHARISHGWIWLRPTAKLAAIDGTENPDS